MTACAACSARCWILLALIFLIEAWLWDHLEPIVALDRRAHLRGRGQGLDRRHDRAAACRDADRVRCSRSSLLFPVKLSGLWLLARRQWFAAGMVDRGLAKLVGLAVTAFIFEVTKPKLLQAQLVPLALRARADVARMGARSWSRPIRRADQRESAPHLPAEARGPHTAAVVAHPHAACALQARAQSLPVRASARVRREQPDRHEREPEQAEPDGQPGQQQHAGDDGRRRQHDADLKGRRRKLVVVVLASAIVALVLVLLERAPRQFDGALALAVGRLRLGCGSAPRSCPSRRSASPSRPSAPDRLRRGSVELASVRRPTSVKVLPDGLGLEEIPEVRRLDVELSAAVCALLPSVSENARNSASTAISSAIRLLRSLLSRAVAAAMLVMLDLVLDLVLHRMHTVTHVASPMQSDRRVNARSAGSVSRPRMGAAIDFQQAFGVNSRIDLRGRERRVAEQFLDRAQVAAARQQMGGEGMPERMRASPCPAG